MHWHMAWDHRLQEVVWGSLQEPALCSDPEGTLLSQLPLHREVSPPHRKAWLCDDTFLTSSSPLQPGVAWLEGVLCQCLELGGAVVLGQPPQGVARRRLRMEGSSVHKWRLPLLPRAPN